LGFLFSPESMQICLIVVMALKIATTYLIIKFAIAIVLAAPLFVEVIVVIVIISIVVVLVIVNPWFLLLRVCTSTGCLSWIVIWFAFLILRLLLLIVVVVVVQIAANAISFVRRVIPIHWSLVALILQNINVRNEALDYIAFKIKTKLANYHSKVRLDHVLISIIVPISIAAKSCGDAVVNPGAHLLTLWWAMRAGLHVPTARISIIRLSILGRWRVGRHGLIVHAARVSIRHGRITAHIVLVVSHGARGEERRGEWTHWTPR
jgi:hypothetical protein